MDFMDSSQTPLLSKLDVQKLSVYGYMHTNFPYTDTCTQTFWVAMLPFYGGSWASDVYKMVLLSLGSNTGLSLLSPLSSVSPQTFPLLLFLDPAILVLPLLIFGLLAHFRPL